MNQLMQEVFDELEQEQAHKQQDSDLGGNDLIEEDFADKHPVLALIALGIIGYIVIAIAILTGG